MNESALKLLGSRGNADQLIFALPSSTAANDLLKTWIKRAEIPKHITWHCVRHSFGTNILYFDGNVLSVSKLLGHTSLTYTMRYLRAVDEMKEKSVNKLPKIELA